MTIGERIRLIRKRQQRTIQEIADICGFTRSLLSQIETGRTVPPLATLTRIAAALGVTVSALLNDQNAAGTVHTTYKALESAELIQTDKGYRFLAIAGGRADKLMEPILFEARRGEVKRKPLSHRGEEFVLVLNGQMRYRVGSVEYLLSEGDSLYFDAEQEHDLEPVTEVVRYLAVFCEPASPQRTAIRQPDSAFDGVDEKANEYK
jgi:transcriptional regulator with XRE-family HTH domain